MARREERSSSDRFEVFYNSKNLPQIDVQDTAGSYNITLTFEKDLKKSLKLYVGSLEIETRFESRSGKYDSGSTLQVESRILNFTETQVTPMGRTLMARVPKRATVGEIPGELFCPGLVMQIPRLLRGPKQIHVALIHNVAPTSRINVGKGTLSVKGAMLHLDCDGASLHFKLSVNDSSAAKEFKVFLETEASYQSGGWRSYKESHRDVYHISHEGGCRVGRVLASSREGSHISGSWSLAKPPTRRVIAGDGNPFGLGGVLRSVYWAHGLRSLSSQLLGAEQSTFFVVGDPALPNVKYRIKLVADRGWWLDKQEDEAPLAFQ